MSGSHVLILGSGHLAVRVRKLAAARGIKVVPHAEPALESTPAHASRYESAVQALRALDLNQVSRAVLVDDLDERNLELAIALISLRPRLPILASMYNENVAPHLQAANPDLHVLNPARIAAPAFVGALDTPIERSVRYTPLPPPERRAPGGGDRLVRLLAASFAVLLLGSTAYFHFAERLPWLDALYFVVVTMATVGYGDISLLHASPASKIVGIALILASTVFIWVFFSLTVDRIIKARVEMALGRRRHKQSGHVILCGLGRLGFLVAERLLERGERVLVIERNEESAAREILHRWGRTCTSATHGCRAS